MSDICHDQGLILAHNGKIPVRFQLEQVPPSNIIPRPRNQISSLPALQPPLPPLPPFIGHAPPSAQVPSKLPAATSGPIPQPFLLPGTLAPPHPSASIINPALDPYRIVSNIPLGRQSTEPAYSHLFDDPNHPLINVREREPSLPAGQWLFVPPRYPPPMQHPAPHNYSTAPTTS